MKHLLRRGVLLPVLVLGIAGCLWFFLRRGDLSPEEEIRLLLSEVQERVADRYVLKLLDHLHPEYRHGDGQEAKHLKPFLLGLVPPIGRERVSLFYRGVRIETHLDGVELEVWCLLVFSDAPIEQLEGDEAPPGRSQAFRVVCNFKRHEGEYKVIRSSGGPRPTREFLAVR